MISNGRLRARILLGAIFLLGINAFAVIGNRRMALAGDVDFRALYAAGAIVRTGRAATLYDYDFERQIQNSLIEPRPVALPFLYPPYAALPFVPLSRLPYRSAYLVFLALNVFLLAATAVIVRPCLPALRKVWPPLPFIFFLCFLPVAIALFQGQVSVVLLLLFCSSYVALEYRRRFLSGLLLALALIKFHVVLPVILLFLIWRAWRVVAGFLTGAASLVLLSIAVTGPAGLRLYAQSLTAAATTGAIGAQSSAQESYNVFAAQMPNLQGIAFALMGPAKFNTSQWNQPPWPTLLVLFLSAAILLYTVLQPPSFPRALVAGLLVSYHLHLHDLTLLLLPLSLALNEIFATRKSRTSSHSRHLLTLTALLWLSAPLHLLLMATGWKSLFAPLMLPFLIPSEPTNKSTPILTDSDSQIRHPLATAQPLLQDS